MTCTYCGKNAIQSAKCTRCSQALSVCIDHSGVLDKPCPCGGFLEVTGGAIKKRKIVATEPGRAEKTGESEEHYYADMPFDQDGFLLEFDSEADENSSVYKEEKHQEVEEEPVTATSLVLNNNFPFVQQLNNLQSQALADPNSNLNNISGAPVRCPDEQAPLAIHWVGGTGKLTHEVEICKGTIVRFGNGFARMRKVEAGLQASTGIQIRQSGAVAGSPNNALGELRLLVSNRDCQYRQLIVTFVDTENQHLLYRSTGGRVMEYRVNENGERLKQLKTVLFEGKTYVYTGAFSICTEASEKAQWMWVHVHDGDYMRKMKVAGKAGEHFHHSEQSFFRLLHDHAAKLPERILAELKNKDQRFADTGPFTLHVISIDIFTTRAACDNCAGSSVVVLHDPEHFFEEFKSALGNSFTAAAGLRSLVRIDCAVRHNNTPDKETCSDMPTAAKAMVHALPPANTAGTSDLEGQNIVQLTLPVPINTAQYILQAGGDKRHWTIIQRYLAQLKQLGGTLKTRDDIFDSIVQHLRIVITGEPPKGYNPAGPPQYETFLLVALELAKGLEANKWVIESDKARKRLGEPVLSPASQRVLQVFRCSHQGGVPVEKTLWIMIRHFRQFGFDSPAGARSAILEMFKFLQKGQMEDVKPVDRIRLKNFFDLVKYNFDSALKDVKADVTTEIQELCESADTGADEDAAALALDFDLTPVYEKMISE